MSEQFALWYAGVTGMKQVILIGGPADGKTMVASMDQTTIVIPIQGGTALYRETSPASSDAPLSFFEYEDKECKR